jgi:hypothetical protein
VLLDRQLVLAVEDDRVVRALPTSTGASHGCVRLAPWDAEWLYGFASVGDRVTVLARS